MGARTLRARTVSNDVRILESDQSWASTVDGWYQSSVVRRQPYLRTESAINCVGGEKSTEPVHHVPVLQWSSEWR